MIAQKLIVPEPLKKGDVIGIAAPAGQIHDRVKFEAGIRILGEMGFQTCFPRDLWPGNEYLADSDYNRASELTRFFSDSSVKAIVAARGGYGCLRILDQIDYEHIRKNPKLLIGFSDLTLLLSQCVIRSHLQTYHGPVVTSLPTLTNEALERFYLTLTGRAAKRISFTKIEVIRGGDEVSGALFGGNLSTLLTVIGTAYDYSWDDTILFIEDVNEPLYKVDRMLTQLAMTGKLANIKGLILGDFGIVEEDPLLKLRYTEGIWNRVMELTSSFSYPVWGNFPVGHFDNNFALPLGGNVVMDSSKATLFFAG